MSTTVTYKGNTLTTVTNQTRTLNTAGKWLEGDITLVDVTSGGTPAISVVDTTDTHGGTIRTITALDISDTTAVASDVASGKYFYTAAGVKTQGTDSGGSPSATSHTIYFEFSDSTNTSIVGYWDSSFISDSITATTPTTYGGKTVTLAQLDGVTWYSYSPSGETWNTILEGSVTNVPDTPYNYIWLSTLSDVYPTDGSVWRITIDNTEYRVTAATVSNVVIVGNPKYEGGTDDGSGVPFSFTNQGWGAWVGNNELPAASGGTSYSLKIEQRVSA